MIDFTKQFEHFNHHHWINSLWYGIAMFKIELYSRGQVLNLRAAFNE